MCHQEAAAPEGTARKIGLMIVDKLLPAVVAAITITILQNRLEITQERLEKARRLGDIAVDKPLAIVASLPGHLDQVIVYARHVRAGEISVQSDRLTELQTNIDTEALHGLVWVAPEIPAG